MNEFLISVVAFIIALGVLVTVHEFGHFWVARKMGVKVLRFSVGFGKAFWRYQKNSDSTEYVAAMIPLGGYVKMLDEREGVVAENEKHLAFNNKSVWARIAIVAAGPVFNFLLAIIVYAIVFMMGIPGMKPVVGEVFPESISSQANFRSLDEIVAVDGKPTNTWQEVRLAILESAVTDNEISFSVIEQDNSRVTKVISLGETKLLKEQGDVIEKLGFKTWWPDPEPVIAGVLEGQAAAKAGLQAGDRILTVDDNVVDTWSQWAAYVRGKPKQTIKVELERDNTIVVANVTLGAMEHDASIGFVGASVDLPVDEIERMQVLMQYPLFDSIGKGVVKTWDMTLLTFRMLGELLVGNASPRNISGPITIAEYAGKSASIDLSYFLDFLAIISISLGVLNLLPVPLLDGGHLLYYFVEILKGSPVSEKTQVIGQQVGLVILACLMSLAFYNDISRILG